MFKPLFNKINFLWKPHKAPETMDYPYKYVLSKDYKDPDKIAEKLDEFLGKDGWDKLDVSLGVGLRRFGTRERKQRTLYPVLTI